jgi:hypothetical protein
VKQLLRLQKYRFAFAGLCYDCVTTDCTDFSGLQRIFCGSAQFVGISKTDACKQKEAASVGRLFLFTCVSISLSTAQNHKKSVVIR